MVKRQGQTKCCSTPYYADESIYESRSNYQLQTIEMQHLKKPSLILIQTKQRRLSIAFDILNHQFSTSIYIYATLLNFAP